MNDAWIAGRMTHIDASGIRKAFDMAKAMTDPINLSIGLPDFDVAGPVKAAAIAAAFTGSGTSKSGSPIDRLIGSFIVLAISNALRMPEASMCCIRSAIQESFTVRFAQGCQWPVASGRPGESLHEELATRMMSARKTLT